MKFFIKTFGCQQNKSDSERITSYYVNNGDIEVKDYREADLVIINSCIVRESAENRVYGLVNKIDKYNIKYKKNIKIIITGCLAGDNIAKKIPANYINIRNFNYNIEPLRDQKTSALISISSGCNNFCSYCIVPYARGKEVSRSFDEVLSEVDKVIKDGFREILLIGQNVNSYGADFATEKDIVSMGKKRFKSMFPKLLEEIAKKHLDKISFVSSNPWDFSDELIDVIAKYKNIDRLLHLPIQSGDDEILKKMNRGYSTKEYLDLIKRIRKKVPDVKFSTDIIIGFPSEDDNAFENTYKLCKEIGFEIGYLNKYSPRSGTLSAKLYQDVIPQKIKKERWNKLNDLINKKLL